MRIKQIIHPYCNYAITSQNRLDYAIVGRNRKTSKTLNYGLIISLLIAILLLAYSLTYAIDTSIKNQDIMLCESAKKSGNRDYLQKCACYYETSNIACMQEGGAEE